MVHFMSAGMSSPFNYVMSEFIRFHKFVMFQIPFHFAWGSYQPESGA